MQQRLLQRVCHEKIIGYNVVATARTPAKPEQIRQIAPGSCPRRKARRDGVGDAEKAVAAAVARFGTIDVLLNNAGYGIVGAASGARSREATSPEGLPRRYLQGHPFTTDRLRPRVARADC